MRTDLVLKTQRLIDPKELDRQSPYYHGIVCLLNLHREYRLMLAHGIDNEERMTREELEHRILDNSMCWDDFRSMLSDQSSINQFLIYSR